MTDVSVDSLRVFSDPDSLAVVGASERPSKWGYWLASGALDGRDRRRVELVNQRAGRLFDVDCAPSLTALDRAPELVALCVPPAEVPKVVNEGLALGVRGFLGITAGIQNEPELAERIRTGGARLLGANSLGIYDADTRLRLAWGGFSPGPLAIVSQSGQLGSELAILGERQGIGVSRFVSIGNQSDVRAGELLADLADHEPTKAIALYLESFTEATSLFETLAALRETGRPVVLLTIGADASSTRLARSHTGSLTSRMDVVDAACRDAGVVRVDSPTELIETVRTLLTAPTPSGNRIAVIGDSGGQCGIAADQAAAAGLEVPVLSEPTRRALAEQLPEGAASSNPVDLAGAGEQDLANYAVTVERALADDSVSAAVLTGYFGRYVEDVPQLRETEQAIAHRLGTAAAHFGKPVIAHSMAEPSGLDALWHNGIPAFCQVSSAVRALAASARSAPPRRAPAPELPEPYGDSLPGYWSARRALEAHGVRFPAARVVHEESELAQACEGLRAPFVLKAGWLAHKTEAGGVALGLADHAETLASFTEMRARLGPGEYVLEELDQRPDTVELLVGIRRDPGFGPVLVVGRGGTETEVHADVTVRLAPASPETVLEMLDQLRCAPLLAGWRGKPAPDRRAFAELASAVSGFAAANPALSELELNPVRLGPEDALAVDAVLTRGAS